MVEIDKIRVAKLREEMIIVILEALDGVKSGPLERLEKAAAATQSLTFLLAAIYASSFGLPEGSAATLAVEVTNALCSYP